METLRDLLKNEQEHFLGSVRENDLKWITMYKLDDKIVAAHLWRCNDHNPEIITAFRVWTNDMVYETYWCAHCDSERVRAAFRNPFKLTALASQSYFEEIYRE